MRRKNLIGAAALSPALLLTVLLVIAPIAKDSGRAAAPLLRPSVAPAARRAPRPLWPAPHAREAAPVARDALPTPAPIEVRLVTGRVRGAISGARVWLSRRVANDGRAARPDVPIALGYELVRSREQGETLEELASAVSGLDGAFSLAPREPLAGGARLVVTASDERAPGTPQGSRELVVARVARSAGELAPNASGTIDVGELELASGRCLEIVVRGGGAPLEGATVEGTTRGTTDRDGRVRLETRSPVSRFAISKTGFVSRLVSAGPDDRRLDVALEPDALVAGRVESDRRRPLQSVHVTARVTTEASRAPGELDFGPRRDEGPRSISLSTQTDANGRFVLRGLGPGRVARLRVDPEEQDLLPAELDVAPPAPSLELVLEQAASILVLLEPPPGASLTEPPGDLYVWLERLDPATGDWRQVRDVPHLSSLATHFWRLEEGTYFVGTTGSRELGLAPASASIVLNRGQRELLRLALAPGRTVTGRVVTASGPVASATVTLMLTDRRRIAISTDLDGRFALRGVPEGELELRVDGAADVAWVKLAAGQTNVPDVVLVSPPS